MGSNNLKAAVIDGKNITYYLKKIDGKPIDAFKETLDEIVVKYGDEAYLGVTGVNSISLSDVLNEKQMINESIAAKGGIAFLDLNLNESEKFAVIDVGASNQRCYEFGKDKNSGKIILEHHYLQNKCGAGSGLLLEHMAKRFKYNSTEELSHVANQTEKTIKLSAKCGVFRESDVVHQQQKGTLKEVLAASLYRASADSFKTILSNGIIPEGMIIFIGGLSFSKAFIKHLMDVCKISSERVLIPKQGLHIGAIGATVYGQQVNLNDIIKKIEIKLKKPFNYESQGPLILKKSIIMKPKEDWPYHADIPLAGLGIDIGSVSTKAALIAEIDGKFKLLAYHYRRTEIDPVGAAIDVINKVYSQVMERDYKIKKIVAGTTGSGRQLTGFIVGASKEHIVDEITAQAAGIITVYPQREFSIIEFGGQDSKFINIDQGVVVDFAMNNACAAGTGALIEKYAMRRGIRLEDFGDIALKAKNPPDIDSTCAVLSEQSIIKYEQNNVSLENLCAALTLATARNYLAKVVSGLEIKEKIVFQGATAFNLGQVAALETVLGKGIVVPPWPHITGAIGSAKYAYDTYNLGNFRGFKKISNLKYNIGPYECTNKNCGNDCNITRAEIIGKEKIFYFIGDRCQRYSAKKDDKKIKPPNLFKERQKIMEDSCQ
ncbi:MAG: acyl-CoA dehydratase activase [Atribacterota bacterium]|nr:acyl-CoA dehydratase activase [Atribacterota bacterium]